MSSITDGPVDIQTSSASNPSTPSWFGEVVVITAHLRKHNVLSKITEHVRFGHYDVIDFCAVLAGLCDQWRTHPGGVLPAPAALCGSVYGLV